jgi:hypothetical protein
VADRKPFLLRIDSVVLEGVQRWANDDLRSLNAQIEYLLRESLRRAGRVSRPPGGSTEQDPPNAAGDAPNEPDPSADT